MKPPRWVVRWVARNGPLVYITETRRGVEVLMKRGRIREFSGSTWVETLTAGTYRLVSSDG